MSESRRKIPFSRVLEKVPGFYQRRADEGKRAKPYRFRSFPLTPALSRGRERGKGE